MSEKASANTGLPSVASMSGNALSVADVARLASKNDGPAISGVSEDTPIPLDDSQDPTPASVAPAQDATTPTPAQDAPTPAPETATFDLPEEKPPVEDQTTPTTPDSTTIPPANNGSRNYADFPEELHPVLKSLNNANFAKMAPRLKELYTEAQRAKQLETELGEAKKGPQFFYEHPEGYRLSPEYQQIEGQLTLCEFEAEHWRNQLIAIKSGQPWTELKGYKTDAQGHPVEPVFHTHQPLGDGKIDSAAEVHVMGLLQQTAATRQNIANRAQSIIGGYAQSGERARGELAEVDKRLFAKLGDVTKLPEAERKHYDLATAAVPQYFRGHPLVDMLGKAFVMYNRLLQRTITAQQEVEKLRAEAAGRKAAPIGRIPAGGGAVKPSKEDVEIKIDDL